jgi:hypothetical protein
LDLLAQFVREKKVKTDKENRGLNGRVADKDGILLIIF